MAPSKRIVGVAVLGGLVLLALTVVAADRYAASGPVLPPTHITDRSLPGIITDDERYATDGIVFGDTGGPIVDHHEVADYAKKAASWFSFIFAGLVLTISMVLFFTRSPHEPPSPILKYLERLSIISKDKDK